MGRVPSRVRFCSPWRQAGIESGPWELCNNQATLLVGADVSRHDDLHRSAAQLHTTGAPARKPPPNRTCLSTTPAPYCASAFCCASASLLATMYRSLLLAAAAASALSKTYLRRERWSDKQVNPLQMLNVPRRPKPARSPLSSLFNAALPAALPSPTAAAGSPDGDAVAPPQLAGDAPVLDVLQPKVVDLRLVDEGLGWVGWTDGRVGGWMGEGAWVGCMGEHECFRQHHPVLMGWDSAARGTRLLEARPWNARRPVSSQHAGNRSFCSPPSQTARAGCGWRRSQPPAQGELGMHAHGEGQGRASLQQVCKPPTPGSG